MTQFLSILALLTSLMTPPVFAADLPGTVDVLFGPADPATPEQWQAWRKQMESYRLDKRREIGLPPGGYPEYPEYPEYEDPRSRWTDSAYRQFHLFMYDEEFFHDGAYHTAEWLDKVERRFGKIDSVILWQAYPQLGIDTRNQFDFYRTMSGGLSGLRKDVSDVLHARGVKVVVDFNPWDHHPDYEELADIVAALDADAIMLDTLNGVPSRLKEALDRRKPGVVLAPERRPADRDLLHARASWAQWYDLGPAESRPAIYRHKWIIPQHMQHAIRRWDTDRTADIVFSFFNASGLVVWDNIFGSWNPYRSEDRKLMAETAVALRAYKELFSRGDWDPLLPTGQAGLDMNRWEVSPAGRKILTFRNRTGAPLGFTVPGDCRSLSWFALWSDGRELKPGDLVTIPAHGTQALVLDEPAHALETIAALRKAGQLAAAPEPSPGPSYELRTPAPTRIGAADRIRKGLEMPMVALPGGEFEMRIDHARRESGCYPWGADAHAMWGWHYTDPLTHRIRSFVSPFAIKTTAVTNAEYLRFVRESGYQPKDPDRFLKQIPRQSDGSLPERLPAALSALPVTYVSLEDARAFARWSGTRLPTEAEWQWAAEGAGAGHLWPWGATEPGELTDGFYNRAATLAPADAFARGATPQGVLGLTGNAWELTDSEWSDGHNRFVMLRGGTYMPQPPNLSEWMLPRGPHANTYHAKYFLMSDGLDRSETIGFRVVRDLAP